MDRKMKPGPNISERHPRPAEMMQLVNEQNRMNDRRDISMAPSLAEQLRYQAAVYAAVNAPHNARVRRGIV